MSVAVVIWSLESKNLRNFYKLYNLNALNLRDTP